MENFKEKLYHYQITPPPDIWSKIETGLDDQKVIQLPGLRKKSSWLFYGLTAAAALVILLISGVFFTKNKENQVVAKVQPTTQIQPVIPQVHNDSIVQNQEILESIINTKKNKNLIASVTPRKENGTKEYITIAGAEGQPVKISQKAATLIISADDEYPPKAKWDKQIDEWQQIMLDNMLSPTPTNLMDIMQKASHLE
jgi:hypothetical protein